MPFVARRHPFRGYVSLPGSCLLAVAAAAAARAQDSQGFTGVNRTVVPGVAGDLVSDIAGFYQRYRFYILGLLAIVFLRWLWRVVTPRGNRD